MGPENEPSNESSLMAKGLVFPPPPAWRMDVTLLPIGNLLDSVDPKSETAVKINLAILDYEKKCAIAKIDLINDIKTLFSES